MHSNDTRRTKRPILVWVIFVYIMISASFYLLSLFLVLTGAVPLEPAQQVYFENLTPLDYGLTILLGVANLAGAIALLLLRKLAFYLFSGAFALVILVNIWHMVGKGWLWAAGVSVDVVSVIGLAIALAICLYSWRLVKVGLLTQGFSLPNPPVA